MYTQRQHRGIHTQQPEFPRKALRGMYIHIIIIKLYTIVFLGPFKIINFASHLSSHTAIPTTRYLLLLELKE